MFSRTQVHAEARGGVVCRWLLCALHKGGSRKCKHANTDGRRTCAQGICLWLCSSNTCVLFKQDGGLQASPPPGWHPGHQSVRAPASTRGAPPVGHMPWRAGGGGWGMDRLATWMPSRWRGRLQLTVLAVQLFTHPPATHPRCPHTTSNGTRPASCHGGCRMNTNTHLQHLRLQCPRGMQSRKATHSLCSPFVHLDTHLQHLRLERPRRQRLLSHLLQRVGVAAHHTALGVGYGLGVGSVLAWGEAVGLLGHLLQRGRVAAHHTTLGMGCGLGVG